MWRLGPVVGCKIPKFGFPHRNSKIERKNHASIFFSFLQKYTTTATLLRDRTVRIALVTEVIGSGPRGRGNSINGITSAVPGSQRALTQW